MMDQSFYPISNELEHHFSNNETTGIRTILFASMERTSNLVGPITRFTKLIDKQTGTSLF